MQWHITCSFSRESFRIVFTKFELIAAAIAFPVAYYFMNGWLKVFSYNGGLSVIPFMVSALVIVLTAALTATFHSTRAALAPPAKNLRTE